MSCTDANLTMDVVRLTYATSQKFGGCLVSQDHAAERNAFSDETRRSSAEPLSCNAEFSMTLEQQATFANGLLVMASAILAVIPATSTVGLWCTGFMGTGLIISGVTSYCGWVRILARIARNSG